MNMNRIEAALGMISEVFNNLYMTTSETLFFYVRLRRIIDKEIEKLVE